LRSALLRAALSEQRRIYAAEPLKRYPSHLADQATVTRLQRIGMEAGKSFDVDGFQVAKSIFRFSIHSFDELKYHPDDSLDIYIQHESPGAATSHCSLS
jgi:hypothetical protein